VSLSACRVKAATEKTESGQLNAYGLSIDKKTEGVLPGSFVSALDCTVLGEKVQVNGPELRPR
jgi:hypothetical protein